MPHRVDFTSFKILSSLKIANMEMKVDHIIAIHKLFKLAVSSIQHFQSNENVL